MPRRPKKGKSSSLLIRKLVKELSPIESAILRERILFISEMTKQDILANPSKYEHGIIAKGLLESTLDKIITGLQSDVQTGAENNPDIKIAVQEVELVS
jgi:hypothetical protein